MCSMAYCAFSYDGLSIVCPHGTVSAGRNLSFNLPPKILVENPQNTKIPIDKSMNENIVEIQTQKNTIVTHHFFLCKQTKYGKCVHQSMCSPSFGLHTIPSRIFQALYFS